MFVRFQERIVTSSSSASLPEDVRMHVTPQDHASGPPHHAPIVVVPHNPSHAEDCQAEQCAHYADGTRSRNREGTLPLRHKPVRRSETAFEAT
jgi:hypothetical protein